MNVESYLKTLKTPENFTPTHLTTKYYLDIMEMCLDAYQTSDIESAIQLNEKGIIDDIHATSRIACVLGALISKGRKTHLKPLWARLMTACCITMSNISGDSRADFSVKEILLGYFAMEDQVPADLKEKWLKLLGAIEPYTQYRHLIRSQEDIAHLHNINIYNMVGEAMREHLGLTDTTAYFDKHWPRQLQLFDENGMYQDPGCPILYDITTRCQIQIMLGLGYRGTYFESLDAFLKAAGPQTLMMQSAAFQLPYGGRSNQFLFNEALIASNCEYEATRAKKSGDLALAGIFKRSAHLAARSIDRWLKATPPRHIKNFYPADSGHGTEGYGYYNKYMVTLGSFIYIGYLFADDDICEAPCPAEVGGYVMETPAHFHKIFANAQGRSIEIDTGADFHYDATGLGRFHRVGIPTELGLSMPFTATPSYFLSQNTPVTNAAIGPGWEAEDGTTQFLAELSEGLEHKLEVFEQSPDCVRFAVTYFGSCFRGCQGVTERYTLNEHGLNIETTLIDPLQRKLYFSIPLFASNGLDEGQTERTADGVVVKCDAYHQYTVKAAGQWTLSSERIANRNGEYHRGMILADSHCISIHLDLEAQE